MGSFHAAKVCFNELEDPGVGVQDNFNMIGFGEQRYLYIIQTNLNADVIKIKVDDGKMGHIKIPNSKIPNLHSDQSIHGIRVGNFFWIVGGSLQCGVGNSFKPSSLNPNHSMRYFSIKI